MRNLYPRWYYKQSSSHFFSPLHIFLSVLDTPTHAESIVPVQKIRFNTPAALDAAVEVSANENVMHPSNLE